MSSRKSGPRYRKSKAQQRRATLRRAAWCVVAATVLVATHPATGDASATVGLMLAATLAAVLSLTN